MLKQIAPSSSRVGEPKTSMSATIRLGIANSESARSPVIRAKISSASGPGIRKRIWCRSPTNVSDCQSIERYSVSKILSLLTSARARSARSKAAPAWDMGRRFTGLPPGKRGRDRRSLLGALSLYANRIRNADRLLLPARNGSARFGSDSGTSRLHEVNALAIPHCPNATRLPINSQCNSYLSRYFPITMKKPC